MQGRQITEENDKTFTPYSDVMPEFVGASLT
jgi:hypothetical protein